MDVSRAQGGRVFGEEATGNGRVGVEADSEAVEEREEFRFAVSGDGVVVALEGGWEDGVSGSLNVVDLLDVVGKEVGEAELGLGIEIQHTDSLRRCCSFSLNGSGHTYAFKLSSSIQLSNG